MAISLGIYPIFRQTHVAKSCNILKSGILFHHFCQEHVVPWPHFWFLFALKRPCSFPQSWSGVETRSQNWNLQGLQYIWWCFQKGFLYCQPPVDLDTDNFDQMGANLSELHKSPHVYFFFAVWWFSQSLMGSMCCLLRTFPRPGPSVFFRRFSWTRITMATGLCPRRSLKRLDLLDPVGTCWTCKWMGHWMVPIQKVATKIMELFSPLDGMGLVHQTLWFFHRFFCRGGSFVRRPPRQKWVPAIFFAMVCCWNSDSFSTDFCVSFLCWIFFCNMAVSGNGAKRGIVV